MISEMAGGSLIGISAALLWLGIGRISGMSGIISSLFTLHVQRYHWVIWFLIGIIMANPVYRFSGGQINIQINDNILVLLCAGLLVGAGAYIGNGCTSGHSICGVGRLSGRSIVSTIVFIMMGMITVAITG
ncbi:YeeE/YedE family protein [Gynuella sunshinyii]|uniref:Putative transporter component n=1 Tax=Gynuella sunshinyii YC6258 TaxID=1445510 RepID=A0A0C5VH39_9GAMM|nr:membrane protein [Gynuella sunshinyii]AJQ93952.1 putative transporter component [Gynuella sunshinyii YC6258]